MKTKISMVITLLFISGSINFSFAVDKNKRKSEQASKEETTKNNKLTYQENSKGAIDIKTLYEQIRSKVNDIKEDPFDPNIKKNKVKEVYDGYKNTLVFIPFEGKQFPSGTFSNNQELTTLSYHDGTIRFSFGDSELRYLWLGYVSWYDSKACGNETGFSAYSIDLTPARVKSCLHGIGKVSECKNTYGYQSIAISNVDIEKVRALSGNIERYVTIHNISSIDTYDSTGLGDYIGEGRYRCTGHKGTRRMIYLNGYRYEFINKLTGETVFGFEGT